MSRHSNVLLFSGGVDSFIGYHYLCRFSAESPLPLYFNLSSRYSEKEMNNFHRLNLDRLPIIDNSLSFLGSIEQEHNAHIPFRNLYMAMTAVAKYGDRVWICGLKDDVMTDKNKGVFREWSEHLSKLEERPIEIISPFWTMTKLDIVQWYAEQYDSRDLLNTVSCYSPGSSTYCGHCQACFRKACCLFAVDLPLPFFDVDVCRYYKSRIGQGIYDPQREKSMKQYLQWLEI